MLLLKVESPNNRLTDSLVQLKRNDTFRTLISHTFHCVNTGSQHWGSAHECNHNDELYLTNDCTVLPRQLVLL